jgi:hypothetical protein
MVVVPGLSGALEAVGKHVVSWDDSSGCQARTPIGRS